MKKFFSLLFVIILVYSGYITYNAFVTTQSLRVYEVACLPAGVKEAYSSKEEYIRIISSEEFLQKYKVHFNENVLIYFRGKKDGGVEVHSLGVEPTFTLTSVQETDEGVMIYFAVPSKSKAKSGVQVYYVRLDEVSASLTPSVSEAKICFVS